MSLTPKVNAKNKLKLDKLGHTSGTQYGTNPYARNPKRGAPKSHTA